MMLFLYIVTVICHVRDCVSGTLLRFDEYTFGDFPDVAAVGDIFFHRKRHKLHKYSKHLLR
jgi:hypothetical protein